MRPTTDRLACALFLAGPMGTRSLENSMDSLRVLGSLAVLLALSIAIVPGDYWLDWDTLMYGIDISLNGVGDTGFSFMHNLLKRWMLNFHLLLKACCSQIDFLESVRISTTLCAFFSSLCIFRAIKELTGDSWAFAFSGSVLWLLLPGNVALFHAYEDNVWAATFNCAFLLSMVKIHRAALSGRRKTMALWVLGASASLGIGINLHQQLGILFYLFAIMIVLHYRLDPAWKIALILLFGGSYAVLSAAQNYYAFGDFHLHDSIRRLYYNPYVNAFPHLWFFTSGKTWPEWLAMILSGWRKALLLGGSGILFIYAYIVLHLSLAGYHVLRRAGIANPTISNADLLKQHLWLSMPFLIFIPYSLLYEPQNVERWDSAFPGAIVLLFTALFHSRHLVAEVAGRFHRILSGRGMVGFVLIASLIVSALQVTSHVARMRRMYNKDSAVTYFNDIIEWLGNGDHPAKMTLLLSEGFRKGETDSRLMIYYPAIDFVTLDSRDLMPLHSSKALRHEKPFPKRPVYEIPFPEGTRFAATPRIGNAVKKVAPAFLGNDRRVCSDGPFACDPD